MKTVLKLKSLINDGLMAHQQGIIELSFHRLKPLYGIDALFLGRVGLYPLVTMPNLKNVNLCSDCLKSLGHLDSCIWNLHLVMR